MRFNNFDITNWPTFSGGGQQARLRLQLGDVRTQYYLSFTDPEIAGYPLAFGFDAPTSPTSTRAASTIPKIGACSTSSHRQDLVSVRDLPLFPSVCAFGKSATSRTTNSPTCTDTRAVDDRGSIACNRTAGFGRRILRRLLNILPAIRSRHSRRRQRILQARGGFDLVPGLGRRKEVGALVAPPRRVG